MDKITQILENGVRCNYFEAGVHVKNPIKNSSYQDGLGRTIQTLDHVVVTVHILIWDKRKSQINEYSDTTSNHIASVTCLFVPILNYKPCHMQQLNWRIWLETSDLIRPHIHRLWNLAPNIRNPSPQSI